MSSNNNINTSSSSSHCDALRRRRSSLIPKNALRPQLLEECKRRGLQGIGSKSKKNELLDALQSAEYRNLFSEVMRQFAPLGVGWMHIRAIKQELVSELRQITAPTETNSIPTCAEMLKRTRINNQTMRILSS